MPKGMEEAEGGEKDSGGEGKRCSGRGLRLEFGGVLSGSEGISQRVRTRAGITLEEALDWSMHSGSESEISRDRSKSKRLFSEVSDTEDPEDAVELSGLKCSAKRGRARGSRQTRRGSTEVAREAEFAAALDKRAFLKPASEVAQEAVPPGPLDLDVDKMGADELVDAAVANLQEILGIAGRSTNLKGGYASKIRKATGAVKTVLEALVSRTEAEETRRLRADNGRLRREVENLREEVRAYRRDFEEAKVAAKGQPSVPNQMSSEQLGILEKSVARLVGNMIDSRLSSLEARLPPPPIIRPPLASDRKRAAREERAAQADKVSPTPREGSPVLAVRSTQVATVAPEKAPKPAQKSREEFPALPVRPPVRQGHPPKGKKKGGDWSSFGPVASNGTQVPVVVEKSAEVAAPAPSSAPNEAWTEVVRRRAPRKKKAQDAPVPPVSQKKKGAKLVLPKSSAVVVKLRPEAAAKGETYGSVLIRAQQQLNLEELGIGPIRVKTAATGARLIEVPGRASGEQADALAKKMGELLCEVADVVRPVMKTEFRLTGLDETATKEGIRAAMAAEGGCSRGEVWVGEPQFNFRGVGTVRVSCPVVAAKRLIKLGAIRVGWSRVRLIHEGHKPRHCYRCLGRGHMSGLCSCEKDRSNLCYRCGNPGHKAAGCESSLLRCAICSDAGLKADHVMGGRACNPPSVRGKIPSAPAPSGRGLVAHDAEMTE
ncbi:uncharacterized protein LOC121734405 [Aricia agestis]|uniref:uncharacterized protein LOC121734405 n=1 Tax=Aricia agestis TaxID=91739 RepID=UPI001C20771D|nr:uncharacterized protein LOC121734405 [Aricia agestis]